MGKAMNRVIAVSVGRMNQKKALCFMALPFARQMGGRGQSGLAGVLTAESPLRLRP